MDLSLQPTDDQPPVDPNDTRVSYVALEHKLEHDHEFVDYMEFKVLQSPFTTLEANVQNMNANLAKLTELVSTLVHSHVPLGLIIQEANPPSIPARVHTPDPPLDPSRSIDAFDLIKSLKPSIFRAQERDCN